MHVESSKSILSLLNSIIIQYVVCMVILFRFTKSTMHVAYTMHSMLHACIIILILIYIFKRTGVFYVLI